MNIHGFASMVSHDINLNLHRDWHMTTKVICYGQYGHKNQYPVDYNLAISQIWTPKTLLIQGSTDQLKLRLN